jgi:hypothetical protein
VLESDEAKNVCAKASDALEVDLSLMSCLGDSWHVVDDGLWWPNFSKVKLYLSNIEHDSNLFVFFNGYPKHRVVKVNLEKLLEMLDDDNFFHNIFAFDSDLENAIFDDHSGFFCGAGYFSDAMQKYC